MKALQLPRDMNAFNGKERTCRGQKENDMSLTNNRTKQQNFFLVLMLGALNTVSPITIDMYLPGFPQIASELHTSVGNVALSVSTYFLGFSLGQIIYGPLTDRFGRKRPLYIGLSLYILASAGCALAPSIEALWILRFFQALSGCVAAVTAMAMVRDFFPVEKSAGIISMLILILGVSPLLAPTAGSFIIDQWDWRAVFWTLGIIVFILLLCIVFFLPEGHKADPGVSLKPRPILVNFRSILVEPRFYVFALAGTFSFAGLFVYVSGSPAIFMEEYHVSAKVYGGIFALLSVGLIGGSQLNHLLVTRYSNEQVFTVALIVQVITAIFFFAGVMGSWYGMTAVIVFLFIQLSCCGLTYPNAAAIAMSPFAKNAGSASALLGFIQIGIGGIISSGVGMLNYKGSVSTALIMSASSAIGLIILLAGRKKHYKPLPEEAGVRPPGEFGHF